MSQLHPVPDEFAAAARLRAQDYAALYAESVRDPAGFWGRIGKRLDWTRAYTQVKDVSFAADNLHVRWYADGELNLAANCLDRHLAERGDKTAILWEGDDPAESKAISYRELHTQVGKCANLLKHLGVNKGDRVTIYLPMIPEAAIAMLACARIGAVHTVVFGGFSPDSLAGRIADSTSKLVITADEGLRGGKKVPLKINVAGVIPPIFASSLLLLPTTVANFNAANIPGWLQNIVVLLGHGKPLFILLYAAGIIFFCFFYTAIVFNPEETADNLKKYGGFIPGIRPGKRTAEYIDYVLTRITVIGSLYLTAVCLIPEIIGGAYNVQQFAFGGTSLLIVVSVTMDTVAQIQSHLIAQQYEGLIKKARLKGARPK